MTRAEILMLPSRRAGARPAARQSRCGRGKSWPAGTGYGKVI